MGISRDSMHERPATGGKKKSWRKKRKQIIHGAVKLSRAGPRILDVVYNASNNELVRTQNLVKSAIAQVDAAPFKQWYLQRYGVDIARKKKAAASTKESTEEEVGATVETKKSNRVVRKLEKRQKDQKLDPHIEEQFGAGRLLACISSRPGQCGKADGCILEGKELEFYMKKIQKKKGKGASA